MNQKEKIDYIAYLKIAKIKEDIITKLEYLLNQKDQEKITITSDELAILFLIVEDNINQTQFPNYLAKEITEIIQTFLEHEEKKYSYTKERLKELLAYIKKYRITAEENKKLILETANLYNQKHPDYEQIDLTFLTEICNNIK